jgi:hypothetical protein
VLGNAAAQNVEQMRLVFDHCNQVQSSFGFSLHSIRPIMPSTDEHNGFCTLGTHAVTLDGNSWLQVSHRAAEFTPADGDGLVHFTVEQWIRVTVPMPPARQMLFYEDGNRIWMAIVPRTGTVICGARDIAGTAMRVFGSTSIPQNQWTHIACVFAGRDTHRGSAGGYGYGYGGGSRQDEVLYVFVNGQLDGTAVGQLTSLSTDVADHTIPGPVLIGAHRTAQVGQLRSNESRFFVYRAVAQIGQLRFWDAPRTQPQLRAGMYIEVDSTAQHLVAYFDFRSPNDDAARLHGRHNIVMMRAGPIMARPSNWSVDQVQITGPCMVSGVGCADGSREGFQDMSVYGAIAACAGSWTGFISGVSAKSLCSLDWHVCSGVEAAAERISLQQARAFPGAFMFDSANDCGACHSTCLGAMTGTSINGFCPVSATDYTDPDMGCMGTGCSVSTSASTSCLTSGRQVGPGSGCSWGHGITGVVCCRETGCADRTREGLIDHRQWPRIAVCGGEWTGMISGPSAASLCAVGWHVCNGDDVRAQRITFAEATGFGGCFAFDSANDCGNCHSTCLGAMTGTSINGRCAVSATDFSVSLLSVAQLPLIELCVPHGASLSNVSLRRTQTCMDWADHARSGPIRPPV